MSLWISSCMKIYRINARFSWILKHPSNPVVVLGTNKIDRVTSAVGCLECQLSTEEWFSVWEASNGGCVP